MNLFIGPALRYKKCRFIVYCCVLAVGTFLHFPASASPKQAYMPIGEPVDFDQILQSIHQDQLNSVSSVSVLDSQVTRQLKLLNGLTGKYTDLNYRDHQRIGADWLPALGRMNRMTLAYSHPKSRYYHDSTLYRLINRSLSFFCRYQPLPYCDNWYQQGITRPQSLAKSLINMQATGRMLPGSTRQLVIDAICKDTAVNSPGRNNPQHRYNYGANKAEIALGWIYFGALTRSGYMLSVGAKALYAPLKYTEGEGIQYDRSFDMHHGYLYKGAYGAVLLASVTRGAWYLNKTIFRLQGEKLRFFSKFIRQSVFGQIRGRSMDWNILGRGISRYNATMPDFNQSLIKLMVIDSGHKKQYKDILSRMTGRKAPSYHIRATHYHYWENDFTVHSRPAFYLSVHGVSTRNHAQEIGNQENSKGYWGAEGVMDLMVSGNEYRNIFPLWNWKRLPGATLPDSLIIPANKPPGEGDRRGTSLFCGGVSDSVNGLTVYEINNDLGLYARKAWFMIDNIIYCMGSGIHTEKMNKEVRTTLNQCLFDRSGVIVGTGSKKLLRITEAIDTVFRQAPGFIFHGGIGYIPGGANPLELKLETRSGNWKEINSGNYPAVEASVFELSLNHGVQPAGGRYGYVLLPGIRSVKEIKRFIRKNDFKVINTDSIQALHSSKRHMTQIVFYHANICYHMKDMTLQADKPCLIMLQKIAGKSYKLSVADPTGNEREIRIRITKSKPDTVRSLTVQLPKKPFAGKTTSMLLCF